LAPLVKSRGAKVGCSKTIKTYAEREMGRFSFTGGLNCKVASGYGYVQYTGPRTAAILWQGNNNYYIY
jgi:hypothetical protein